MRRANVEMRGSNDAVDTVNAAANAIAAAESRVAPPTSQKRRWGGFWSISCCFGSQSQKYSKRIGHAVLIPEATSSSSAAQPLSARSLGQPPPITVPFAAPPSSPASFLPSEPPSAAHSPAGLVSHTSIAANMYSPGGPHSIFAVGPYAHETQLVSPPLFSTFTTEPSTAPFTPPPESVHLTTPSSPEVPFAQLLDPHLRNGDIGQRFALSQYEFQMYQFYPGSPVGQLISPGSVISGSGTSSPFPDYEYYAGGLHYPDIRFGVPPKLLNLQSLPSRDWGSSHHGSGTLTPDPIPPKSRDGFILDRQNSTVSPLPSLPPEAVVVDQRVSFELTAEDVVRCVEKGPKSFPKALQTVAYNSSSSSSNVSSSSTNIDKTHIEDVTRKTPLSVDAEEGQRCQKQRSVSLGSIKEFNFDNGNREDSQKPCIGSYWWANEKVSNNKGGEQQGKNWSFFPVTEPGGN